MPIHLSPRPVRTMRKRVANSMTMFWIEMAAKGIVAVAFLAVLSLTPAE